MWVVFDSATMGVLRSMRSWVLLKEMKLSRNERGAFVLDAVVVTWSVFCVFVFEEWEEASFQVVLFFVLLNEAEEE